MYVDIIIVLASDGTTLSCPSLDSQNRTILLPESLIKRIFSKLL